MTGSGPRSQTAGSAEDTVARYVRRWLLYGALAIAALVPLSLLHGPSDVRWWVVLLLAVFAGVGEGTELIIRHRETSEAMTLLEVAVVVNLLLLPPVYAAVAVTAGVAGAHLLRRRPAAKVMFNAGMHACAVSAAGLIMFIDPVGGSVLTPLRALLVLVAVTVFGLVNLVAMRGLLSQIEGPRPDALLNQHSWFLAAGVLGNGAVGVVSVAIGTTVPWLLPLMLTPVAALHLAYRGLARIETLLVSAQAERDLLERVLAGASDGIALLDGAGDVQVWNPAMSRITGRPDVEVMGQNISDVLHTIGPDGVPLDPSAPLLTQRPSDHPAWIAEASVRRADGTLVPARVVHTVLFDDRGATTGDVVAVHDLTREREVQSMKEDFVARVSHELRTPLTPIRGYAQILVSRGDRLNATERDDALNRIVERVTHLTRLVDDLLLAARVSSSDPRAIGEVRPVGIEIEPTVRELVAGFERDHAERRFALEVPDGLPLVFADPLRTNQILTNLISNACKYSPPDTPVKVQVLQYQGHVAVEVADEGPGIPEAEHDRVFERFHRLEPPDRMRTGGIGLGLYIARRLAEAMDGRIELDSSEGGGSTFRLVLQRAEAGSRQLETHTG